MRRKVAIRAGLGVLIAMVAAAAQAADSTPCPPKQYFCWEANLAFHKFGVDRVVAKAKACGWTQIEIAQALKCRGQ